MLAVVIPTLNAAETLPATLESLMPGHALGMITETVVVDGGSGDATPECARRAGVRVLTGPRGRGAQMTHGAAATQATWLLFLHADTRLAPDWAAAVIAHAADPATAGRAGYFRLRLDDPRRRARLVAGWANLRSRWFGLPYGDQGLLIRRDLYDALGGHGAAVLMEDVMLARRLGHARLAELPAVALTSAARYRAQGYVRRSLRNAGCLVLHFAGAPPERIARLYAGGGPSSSRGSSSTKLHGR